LTFLAALRVDGIDAPCLFDGPINRESFTEWVRQFLVPVLKPGDIPWTNGQVERMNRTIEEATVQRYHYDTHEQLKQHLGDFVSAYNFGRRLKTLKGLTPY
jgi:transposase